jgi:hypothetical protein
MAQSVRTSNEIRSYFEMQDIKCIFNLTHDLQRSHATLKPAGRRVFGGCIVLDSELEVITYSFRSRSTVISHVFTFLTSSTGKIQLVKRINKELQISTNQNRLDSPSGQFYFLKGEVNYAGVFII